MASGIGDFCRNCVNHPVFICILKFFQWLPVFFIVAVICWSYYAYVVELCFYTVESIPEKIVYLIPYHVFLFLFLWSYYQTVFSNVGAPSTKFRIPPEVLCEMEEAARPTDHRLILDRFSRDRDLPIAMRAFDGAVRFCEKCNVVKPDRCHHCSVCGQCVLKFDHHCPWVNTCVNFRNYKFFILFLGYALVFCLYIFFTDLKYFIWFWEKGLNEGAGKFHIMFLFFVSGMFSISVSTLFFYHLWLTSRNRTTIESFRDPVFTYGPDKRGFSLGWRENFYEVFGETPIYWILPIFSARGDGMSFETPNRSRGDQEQRLREAALERTEGDGAGNDPDTPPAVNGTTIEPATRWLPETGPWGRNSEEGENLAERNGKRNSYGSERNPKPQASVLKSSRNRRVIQPFVSRGNGHNYATPAFEMEAQGLLGGEADDSDDDVMQPRSYTRIQTEEWGAPPDPTVMQPYYSPIRI